MTTANDNFILTAVCWLCKKRIQGKDFASMAYRIRKIDGKDRVLCLKCEDERK